MTLDEWRAYLWGELVEVVEKGPVPTARPGPHGLTASEARTAFGPGRAVLPPRALVDALALPDEPGPSLRVTVPIRNRDGELYGLDFQLSDGTARLLRVVRVDAAEFDAVFARADELAGARAPIEPPALPPEPRPAGRAGEIRLQCVAAESARSRIGGIPFAPRRFEWPRRTSGRPLAFLVQLDLRELPVNACLPADGTLAFFYDAETQPWGDESGDEDGWMVLHWPAADALEAVQPPGDLDPAQLAPQQGLAAAAGPEPVLRLLGDPDAIQEDPRSGDELLLLQVEPDEPLGLELYDSGRLYFLIAPDALAERRFDAARLRLQSY